MDSPTRSDARKDYRTMRRVSLSACAVLLAACASGYGSGPPGGPVDHIPPKILSIVPDTNATNVTQRDLTVHFDKVINERPSASQATTLADLVIISPRKGKPEADWHRHDLVIHQSRGWLPNTAYTVTILPGIADLRGNVLKTMTSIMFSTGATIPRTAIRGTIFDALRGTPEGGALVEAVTKSDTSIVYVTAADSTGRFTLQGLTPGVYLVRGYVDQNNNRGLDRIEAYDTTTLTLNDSARTEFLTFAHDSLGPRLGTLDATDSVTLRATFDTPLYPTQRLDTTVFALFGPDSSRIPIKSIVGIREDTIGQVHDTTHHPIDSAAIADSTENDTVPRPKPVVMPKPTRALLIHAVAITTVTPLRPKTEYRLHATNVRGANGAVISSDHSVTTPAPRDTTKGKSKPPASPPVSTPSTPAPKRP